jgi:guanine deaminase
MNFVEETIRMAKTNVEQGGRPFACLIVKDGKVLARGTNQVVQTCDPTAHAEIVAIRKATRRLKTEHLTGCEVYVLAEPCPMCLGSLYYCSPDRVVFITQRKDYSRFYRDDRKYFSFGNLYNEYGKPWHKRRLPMVQHPHPDGLAVYRRWKALNPTGTAQTSHTSRKAAHRNRRKSPRR